MTIQRSPAHGCEEDGNVCETVHRGMIRWREIADADKRLIESSAGGLVRDF